MQPQAASYSILPPSLWVTQGAPYQGFQSLGTGFPYDSNFAYYDDNLRSYDSYYLPSDTVPVPVSSFVILPSTTTSFGTPTQL